MDEEVAIKVFDTGILWILSCSIKILLHRNYVFLQKQSPQKGDLLIHHLRWSPFSAGEGYSQQFDKSKFEILLLIDVDFQDGGIEAVGLGVYSELTRGITYLDRGTDPARPHFSCREEEGGVVSDIRACRIDTSE